MDKPELLDLILTAIDAARKEQQRSDIVWSPTGPTKSQSDFWD